MIHSINFKSTPKIPYKYKYQFLILLFNISNMEEKIQSSLMKAYPIFNDKNRLIVYYVGF